MNNLPALSLVAVPLLGPGQEKDPDLQVHVKDLSCSFGEGC
jgi:hypothetical protein